MLEYTVGYLTNTCFSSESLGTPPSRKCHFLLRRTSLIPSLRPGLLSSRVQLQTRPGWAPPFPRELQQRSQLRLL